MRMLPADLLSQEFPDMCSFYQHALHIDIVSFFKRLDNPGCYGLVLMVGRVTAPVQLKRFPDFIREYGENILIEVRHGSPHIKHEIDMHALHTGNIAVCQNICAEDFRGKPY